MYIVHNLFFVSQYVKTKRDNFITEGIYYTCTYNIINVELQSEKKTKTIDQQCLCNERLCK